MTRFLSLSLLCLLMTACVPQASSSSSSTSGATPLADRVHPQNFVGDWKNDQGVIFSFDEDGELAMPGQTARSGLDWRVRSNVLVLRTLDLPGASPREDRLGIVRTSASRLVLRQPDGTETEWTKVRNAVRRLNGSLVYRERMALPPEVRVSVQLYLPGSDVPFASSLAQAAGQVPVPFRVHYLASAVSSASGSAELDKVMLRAALSYENDPLFATAEPLAVSLNEPATVMLQRALPGEADPDPLMVPAQFRGVRQHAEGPVELTLYLEPDGLYLLQTRTPKQPESLQAGSWQQIERNHTIQLAQGADAPLSAALRPAGTLLLASPAVPGGEVELKPVVEALPKSPVPLRGMFRIQNGRAALVECSSGMEYIILASGPAYEALKKAWDKAGQKKGLLVEVEGVLSYQNGVPAPTREVHLPARGEDDIHRLTLTRFKGEYIGQSCDEAYASAPLENTYWRLMAVKGQPAQVFPDQAEPHLILRAKNEAAGSDGCNNFFMQWKSSGKSIHFEPGGSTLMLCPQGDEQARNMTEALGQADTWAIKGSVLELVKDGQALATFEAVSL